MSSILQVLKKQDETAQKMEELRKGQSEIRERQIQDAEMRLSKKRREMLNDFSKIQPDIPFKKHLSLRQNGTGVWLLQSSEFQKFMKSPKSKLWLYGIPGAGKSVLSATVIEHTSGYRTEKIASAYFFFCEYAEKATQSCRNMLGSIARQLALQNRQALDMLTKFYNDMTDLQQQDFDPQDADLLDLVESMSTNFEDTIIIIDGLDECLNDRSMVVERLTQSSRDGTGTIKMLFTSREELDIKICLAAFDNVAIAASKGDVRLYVAAQLKSKTQALVRKGASIRGPNIEYLGRKIRGHVSKSCSALMP